MCRVLVCWRKKKKKKNNNKKKRISIQAKRTNAGRNMCVCVKEREREREREVLSNVWILPFHTNHSIEWDVLLACIAIFQLSSGVFRTLPA